MATSGWLFVVHTLVHAEGVTTAEMGRLQSRLTQCQIEFTSLSKSVSRSRRPGYRCNPCSGVRLGLLFRKAFEESAILTCHVDILLESA